MLAKHISKVSEQEILDFGRILQTSVLYRLAQIIEDFPMEIASEYWHILQNARTDFHQKSLPVRVGATASTTALLDKTEAMFDTVFVRCVSQEYYMRLFPEMYNEVMKPAITELTQKL